MVPAQGLFLLNSPVILESAAALAARLETDRGLPTDAARVEHLYLRLVARRPSAVEQERSVRFVAAFSDELQESGTAPAEATREAWTRLCHTLLISNEFLVVE